VTAKVLAAVLRKEQPDLIIAGTESTDGYTGVVPQQLAELLGLPSLTFARKVTQGDGKVRIERMTATGYEVVESPLPALLSVTSGVVEPRYPTFKGIMAAKTKPIEQPTAADLGLSPQEIGPAGSAQEIAGVRAAPERGSGRKVVDEGEAYLEIVRLLEQVKVI
jgi:electron transfer flavoprotein beta subunit